MNHTGASQSAQQKEPQKEPQKEIPRVQTNKVKPTKRKQQVKLVNVEDYHKSARINLSKQIYAFYSSGSEDQVTLLRNTTAFSRIRLLPRVLVNVSNIDTRVSLLNGQHSIDFPVMVAPVSLHGLANEQGEKATARAAASSGTIMSVSTFATTTMEDIINQDVVQQNGSPLWYQLYVMKDREFTARLVRRAASSGYKALVITIDHPVMGNREVQLRDRLIMPDHIKLANLLANIKEQDDISTQTRPVEFGTLVDPTITWHDIEWIKSLSSLPIIVKGVMTPQDAIMAYKVGCSGIVVSNHGARQLDHSTSTIEALPAIIKILRDISNDHPMDVYVDGGIRRGTDILKALCIGATAVMIGRPVIYGLATNGEQGVKQVLGILQKELQVAMALCGISTMADCNPSFVLLPGLQLVDIVSKL